MRAGSRENESGSGRDATSRQDGLHSGRGRSGNVSGDFTDAESETFSSSSSGPDDGSSAFRQKTWFDAIGSEGAFANECKDGVCPVPWLTTPKIEEDVVNHPSHYTDGGIECIEALEAQLTHEEYRGYLKGCIAKYIWRERHKGQLESLKKAQWYLNRLIELEDVG